MTQSQGAKLVVLYSKPDDTEAFDRRYFEGHVPMVAQLPGLRRMEFHKGAGDHASYYLMAEMSFDSMADLRACTRSDTMAAVIGDVNEFAAGSFTVLIAETVVAQDIAVGGA
jgi:uncharacterized protein (TIGR02118 family)